MKNHKLMGFWSVLGLTIGAQLGTAMFLLPSQMSPYGVWGIVSFFFTGGGALVLSLIFAKLSMHMSKTGGPHVYVYEAFGKNAAFCTGWVYWVISWLSSVPVVMVYVGALEHLCGTLTPMMRLGVQIGTLLFIMFLNIRGALISGIGEIFFSLLKVLPLICIPVWAFFNISLNPFPTLKGIHVFTALNEASLLGFWGYVGLECATTVENCVRNPKVTIPRALCVGSLNVTLSYVLNTSVIMRGIPPDVLRVSVSPYSELLNRSLGPMGGKLMAVFIAIMCLGTLNSWILTSGQIALVAAKEKFFPPFFGLSNTNNSPVASVVLTTILMIVCIFFFEKSRTEQTNSYHD